MAQRHKFKDRPCILLNFKIGLSPFDPLMYWVSVRKVVPTLTSKSAEISLSMAGAKQHYDMGFILVLAVGCTSSRGALVALYCGAPWCL
jgi:hypothetical protein